MNAALWRLTPPLGVLLLLHCLVASWLASPLLPVGDLLGGRLLFGDGGVLLGDLLTRHSQVVRSGIREGFLAMLAGLVALLIARFFVTQRLAREVVVIVRRPSLLAYLALSFAMSIAYLLLLALLGYGIFREAEVQNGALTPSGSVRLGLLSLGAGLAALLVSIVGDLGRASLYFSPAAFSRKETGWFRFRFEGLRSTLKSYFLRLAFLRLARAFVTGAASLLGVFALTRPGASGSFWLSAPVPFVAVALMLLAELVWLDSVLRLLRGKLGPPQLGPPPELNPSVFDDRSGHDGGPLSPNLDPAASLVTEA